MDSPFIVPLAVFAMVALLVAIISLAKIRDQEIDVRNRLYQEELEHQRKMKELGAELEQIKRSWLTQI
jgi:hypothetical protein